MASKRTSFFIDEDLFKAVKVYCAENNISFKKFITDAINEKLK